MGEGCTRNNMYMYLLSKPFEEAFKYRFLLIKWRRLTWLTCVCLLFVLSPVYFSNCCHFIAEEYVVFYTTVRPICDACILSVCSGPCSGYCRCVWNFCDLPPFSWPGCGYTCMHCWIQRSLLRGVEFIRTCSHIGIFRSLLLV